MPKNYIYRMDHDTGFAPNTKYGICSLCGCKRTTIERWAGKGTWIVGIGGSNTGKPGKLIYVMEVEENLPYSQFKKRYPGKSKYLKGRCKAETPVPFTRKFYYFGDNGKDLPKSLSHIIDVKRGCKLVADADIAKLKRHLNTITKGKGYGVYGRPNNLKPEKYKRC